MHRKIREKNKEILIGRENFQKCILNRNPVIPFIRIPIQYVNVSQSMTFTCHSHYFSFYCYKRIIMNAKPIVSYFVCFDSY